MEPRKKIQDLKKLTQQFLQIVNSPNQTYYPNSPHKGKLAIWFDNIAWIVRHQELNRYYYIYGLDRKDVQAKKHVLPYRVFTSIRDSRNLKPRGISFNYASLLRDKFIFGQFLSSLKIPTPRNVALLKNKEVIWLDTMKADSLEGLTQSNGNIDGFCKKLTGLQGKGAFPLNIRNGKIYIGESMHTLAELADKLYGTYLLQERIKQHPEMDRLFPHSLNTMRIVTFNNNGNVEVFNAAMRIGTGSKHVDNWGVGGIAVGIDLETGMLRQNGYYKPDYGRLVDIHPDTGVQLLNYKVPFFKESLDMVQNVHRYLYGIHSIGWDVAVGPDGPILIEANEDWDGSFAMAAEPNFKSRFMMMFTSGGKTQK